jgi:hypothetical protein
MHSRRWLGWALAAWLVLLCGAARAQFEGFAGTVVRFASVEQGRCVLGADDAWLPLTSPLQRASTMGRPPPIDADTYRAFITDAVLEWNEPLRARWQRALARLAPRFEALHLPLPPEVLLIRTNGRDAANAPYTRANAVVLPMAGIPDNPQTDAYILAHELFHVVSRHAPALATRLYATIGFESAAPLQWPAAWLPLRIANPDAPFDRHLMRVTIDGRETAVMPLMMASRAELKPGETFFDVLQTRLLEVTPGDATRPTLPVLRDGEPVWHVAEQVGVYLDTLGRNTRYVAHPEETMADNVAFLVNGWPAPNKALLERIEAVLLAPR